MALILSSGRRSLIVPGFLPIGSSLVVLRLGSRGSFPVRGSESGNGSLGELFGGYVLPRPKITEGGGIGRGFLGIPFDGNGSSLGNVVGVVPLGGWRSTLL